MVGKSRRSDRSVSCAVISIAVRKKPGIGRPPRPLARSRAQLLEAQETVDEDTDASRRDDDADD